MIKNKIKKRLKRYFAFLLVVSLLIPIVPIVPAPEAGASEVDGWDFEYTGSGVEINRYSGSGHNIVIPEKINSRPVVKIKENAFRNRKDLTGHLTMPDTITSIGYEAFLGCSNLTSVKISKGVQTIGDKAFQGSGLRHVVIPDNASKVDRSFADCPNLESAVVGARLQLLYDTFRGCTNLKSIVFRNNIGFGAASGESFTSVKLNSVYGYAGTRLADEFANEMGCQFIPLSDSPISLFFRKNGSPYTSVNVTRLDDGKNVTKQADSIGKTEFLMDDFDSQKTYGFRINSGNISYDLNLTGEQYRFMDFVSLNIKVCRDGDIPVAGAKVSIDGMHSSPVTTNSEGIAPVNLVGGLPEYPIRVEFDGEVIEKPMFSEDIDYNENYIVDLNAPKVKTISGGVYHNGKAVQGVILTAKQGNGRPVYASSKDDGSYRFILPLTAKGDYTVEAVDLGSYEEKGVLTNKTLTAKPDDMNKNFEITDGNRLYGNITDADGKPVSGARLYLEKQESVPNGAVKKLKKVYIPTSNETLIEGVTDQDGYYQFNTLTKGTYKLMYGASHYVNSSDMRNETIKIEADTEKNITLYPYHVSSPRDIQYELEVNSPVELGGLGTVSVKCWNQDKKKYNDLILEVEIPEGVIIDTNHLPADQHYDRSGNKLWTKFSLDVVNSLGDKHFKKIAFSYRLAEGYDKEKVVFAAFVREERAISHDFRTEQHIPELSWKRTAEEKDNAGKYQTKIRSDIRKDTNPAWADLFSLPLDVTDPDNVWDGQHTRYFDNYGNGSETKKDYATWTFHGKSSNEYEFRRFQSGFTIPDGSENYDFLYILSENHEAYPSGAVFPINDEIYMFVYPKGKSVINNADAKKYLAFWGSTGSAGTFMGVTGNKARQFDQSFGTFKHSDNWFLDGTQNRIKDIISEEMQNNPENKEFVIDVFAADYSEGGGMDKFDLVFTNTEITEIQDKSIPYSDFIGLKHANVFKPALTGDEMVTVSYLKENEYEFRGKTMPDSDVRILSLDEDSNVADFHAGGEFKGIHPNPALPAKSGTYAYVAECTKNGVVMRSNIHVVEVLDDRDLADLYLTSASINREKEFGRNPYILTSVWVGWHVPVPVVPVTTTFAGLKEGDEVYYRLSDENVSKKADGDIFGEPRTSFTFLTPGSRDVYVSVMRNGQRIFNKFIGRIYVVLDPSGYVYDKYTQKRIEGATVTCYVLDQDSNTWSVWDAESHSQQNPLITDADGRYAWDVPEGVYKVTADKEGYHPYDTILDDMYTFTEGVSSIVIPPPRLDINMGLENISKPELIRSQPEEGAAISPEDIILCEFNKALKKETVSEDNISLKKTENETIPIDITISKYQDVISIIPKNTMEPGDYKLQLSDGIEDINTGQKLDNTSLAFTVSASAQTQRESFKVVDYTNRINRNAGIEIRFNQEIGYLDLEDVTLLNDKNEKIEHSLSIGEDKKSLIVYPETELKDASVYTLCLSDNISSAEGLMLKGRELEVETIGQVSAPAGDRAEGRYKSGTLVALRSETSGAEIYYTTDNSVPTEESTKYTAPIELKSNTRIKAAAYKEGMTESTVTTLDYTVQDITPVTVEVTGLGGEYNGFPRGYEGEPVVKRIFDESTAEGVPLEVLYESTDGGGYKSRSAPKNAGSYQVTFHVPEDNEEYTGSVSIAFTITKKKLTVTADDKEKIIGNDDPELTYQTNPVLAPGDVLQGSLQYTGSLVGVYDIVEKEAFSHPNYEITFVKGTMNIKEVPGTETEPPAVTDTPDVTEPPAVTDTPDVTEPPAVTEPASTNQPTAQPITPVTITGVTILDGDYNGFPRRYEGEPVVKKISDESVVDEVLLEVLYESTDGGGYRSVSAPKNAGSYQVTLRIPEDNKEYTGSVRIPFTITKKKLTVTADNKEKTIGTEDPELTYQTNPVLFPGDILQGFLTYTGSAAGRYDIIEGEAFSNPNYEITFVKGIMTIRGAAGTETSPAPGSSLSKPKKDGNKKQTLAKTKKPNNKAVPKSKKIKKNKKIKLTAPKGTTLYYTLNGKNPTLKSKKVKPGKIKQIKIKKKTILKVFAKKPGLLKSAVIKRKYTLKR